MCWMCDSESKSFVSSYWAERFGVTWSHFQADTTTARYIDLTTAFPGDGVGDLLKNLPVQPPADIAAAGAVIDAQPGDTSTTATLTVGQGVRSTLNTPGDWDFFKVTLQGGTTYEIGMYGVRGDPLSGYSGVVLADSFVEIYDAAGDLITFGDGGASTQLNTINTGLDVLLAFKPETTGTYYVNARSFDNNTEDGDRGELVGDYDLFVRHSLYEPYYDLDSPLHSIDWGTQFDGTSRNPDGAEGPRVTGNPIENKLSGKNDLYVYFAREGDIFVDNSANPGNLTTTMVAKGLQPWEKAAFNYVFDEYEKVADLNYIETDDRWAADIVVVTYNGTPGPGLSLLGRMSPPDTASEGQTEYNAGDERWTQRDLAPGGFYFGTLIHEFGHGHGMAHPHDTGGRSSVMRDVEPAGIETPPPGPTIPDPIGVWPNYTLGAYDLNQGVYTMMSYQDGWQKQPWGPQLNALGRTETKSGYGWIASLMAFDIAVIQDKYGVNEEWATGDDTYTLKDVNQAAEFDAQGNVTREATSYKSIWDAGGIDQIVYIGSKDANIDLRPATLQYEYGGGGWISYAYGIHGGFTIANAVTIENATSGGGKDTLTGNAADNRLDSGAGNDTLRLEQGGNDAALAGAGADLIYFGASFTPLDSADGGADSDTLILQGNYAGLIFGTGTTSNISGIEAISLLSGANTAMGDTANNLYSYNLTMLDGNVAAGGLLKVNGASLAAAENFSFNGAAESDGTYMVFGGWGVDTFTGGAGMDTFVFMHGGRFSAGDTVNGGAGYDILVLRGDYTIDFNAAGFATALQGIESISLSAFTDTTYAGGGDGEFDYSLTWKDALLGAGQTITVNGSKLQSAETMSFDGSTEADGILRLFAGAGADTLIGGGGNDLLYGNAGGDLLFGNGGADTFRYQATADSVAGAFDTIQGFTHLTDKIDLSVIDADSFAPGNQAFTFIGASPFSGLGALSAGQLRAFQVAGDLWQVQGDTNGDGTADLIIQAIMQPAQPLDGSDFLF